MYEHQHDCHVSQKICIEFEGNRMEVPEGISVAAAVLGYNHHSHGSEFRTSLITGEKRGPYCLIGVCHECLMEIDGKPYQQACMVMVKAGMKIKKQTIKGSR